MMPPTDNHQLPLPHQNPLVLGELTPAALCGGYRVLVLDGPGADAAVGLPEPDRVVVPGRGQDDRVAAHCALVHIHASLPGLSGVRH